MVYSLTDFMLLAAVAAFALTAGAALAAAFVRQSARRAYEQGHAGREVEVAQVTAERDAALEAQRRLAREHETLQRELAETRRRIVEVSEERAALAGRFERLAQVEGELTTAREQGRHWNEACQRAEQRLTETATRLQEQMRAAEERQVLLERVGAEFGDRFKALSNELFEQHGRRFSEQSQANLGNLLNPLREQLGDFRRRVDEVYDKESRERQVLKHEIDSLKQINQRIGEDALNLTRALKGESRTQGAWGELVLERLLEASGLRRGIQYETQAVMQDEEGGRPRPDVIVHLPEKRDLIIDAKVSLTDYERFCAADGESERAGHLAAHLASLRRHVKELADRRYSDLPGVNSLEFVLMFVPVEAAYIEAVHHDDTLHAFALEKRVVIVTTSTLLATLSTVSNLWRFDDRNRNAQDIAERAGRLYDKFVGFVEDLQQASEKLDAARDALASAYGKLSTGRGNLVGQVEKLRELGAKAGKSLPAATVEQAQVDEVQARLVGGEAVVDVTKKLRGR